MPSFKMGRTTEDIRRELSAIQRELKDPRVQGMLLSIVRVEVTNDLSYCTVYVSAMEGMEKAQQAVKGLRSASGFIRRELGRRLQLRHVPELIFKATDSAPISAGCCTIWKRRGRWQKSRHPAAKNVGKTPAPRVPMGKSGKNSGDGGEKASERALTSLE